jgi:hypothetical protein
MVKPRIELAPRAKRSKGAEAIECAEIAGLHLDDWQKRAIMLGLRTHRNRWASFEVGVEVARQNGKGGIIEALELFWLFASDERLIVHTAHLTDTSLEAFWRLKRSDRRFAL